MPAAKSSLARREQRLGWIMVLPAVVVVLVMVLFPFVWNVGLSGRQVRLIDLQNLTIFTTDWSLRNFERVTGASTFFDVLRTTIVYSLAGTFLSIAMGLWAALVMKDAFRGRTFVRGVILFPYIAPVIAVASAWRQMLNPTFGITNEWQTALGFGRIDYLFTESQTFDLGLFEVTVPIALTTVILFEGWRYFPFAYLFLLARLQAIPEELQEAATVDGATPTQKFRYVVWPQMRGVVAVLFLLRFIFTFNKFDDIFLLTGGAAGTQVVSTEVVQWLLGRADVGAAAALSIVLAGLLVVMVVIYFKLFYEDATAEG